MVTREHWWNGLFGPQAKQDIYVRRQGGRWTVEHRRRDISRLWHCDSEGHARSIVEGLRAAGPGHWREVREEPGSAEAR